MYVVKEKKKVGKMLRKLPGEVQSLYRALLNDLAASGPEQPSWNELLQARRETLSLPFELSLCRMLDIRK